MESGRDTLRGIDALSTTSLGTKSEPPPQAVTSGNVTLSREGPLVLRPVFCRFLLATKMCGARGSSTRYHECVAAFDEQARRLGSFTAMPRSTLAKVIAGILCPGGAAEHITPEALAQSGEVIARPPHIQHFFNTSLPLALTHCEVRRRALEERVLAVEEEAEAMEEPASPPLSYAASTSEVRSPVSPGRSVRGADVSRTLPVVREAEKIPNPLENVWPPLPPRTVTEKELPNWMQGIRQWEEELNTQNAASLRALRTHTEVVLRGEVLSCQLLEPEVMHFATRFKPLFERLFTAYADWSIPDPRSAAEGENSSQRPSRRPSLTLLSDQTPTSSRSERNKLPRGHMSFTAFFRFCADFELFPRHASFEEIQQTYKDSECVHWLTKPTPTMEEKAPVEETPPSPPPPPPKAATGSGRKTGPGGAQAGAQAEAPPDPKKLALEARRERAEKRRQAAAVTAAFASAAAEQDSMPELDIGFFQKPFDQMSEIELKTVTYFAAVDQWLGERFIRLADIIEGESENSDSKLSPPGGPSPRNGGAPGTPGPGGGGGAVAATGKEAGGGEKSGDKAGGGGQGATGGPQPPNHTDGLPGVNTGGERVRRTSFSLPNGKEGTQRAGGPHSAASLEAAARAQLPAIVTVSAEQLFEVTVPSGGTHQLTVQDVESMYRLLIIQRDPPWPADEPPPAVPVFKLDKAMRKARAVLEKIRKDCCMLLRADSTHSSAERAAVQFLEALDQQLLERARWGSDTEDVFQGCGNELTPGQFLERAAQLGVDRDLFPSNEDFGEMLEQVGGSRSDVKRSVVISKCHAYRLLALVQERRRSKRAMTLQARLQCLAHVHSEGPTSIIFGLPAFTECLFKLALHRLGSKGTSEIQRGAPAWWKCTWLLTQLGGHFSDQLRLGRCDRRVRALVEVFGNTASAPSSRRSTPQTSPTAAHTVQRIKVSSRERVINALSRRPTSIENVDDAPIRASGSRRPSLGGGGNSPGNLTRLQKRRHTVTSVDVISSFPPPQAAPTSPRLVGHLLDTWWHYLYTPPLPRYIAPMERLVMDFPHLFEPSEAESPATHLLGVSATGSAVDAVCLPCPQCKEPRSPSGWGTPGCLRCGGIEELCLPAEDHLFGALLLTETLQGTPPESSRASIVMSDNEEDMSDGEFREFNQA